MAAWGVVTLALRFRSLPHSGGWAVSVILNTLCVLLFTVSLQPYAAVFLFVFLAIKGILLLRNR